MIRPLPESLLQVFGDKLEKLNFHNLEDLPSNEMVEHFQNTLQKLVCETFPEKEIIISPEDKPYFNEYLRMLK